MAGWMLYTIAFTAVLSLAALWAETALHNARLPLRWTWVATLLVSVIVPLLALSAPARPMPDVVPAFAMPAITLELDATSRGAWLPVEWPIALWLVLSLAVCSWYVLGVFRLVQLKRRWRRAQDEVDVLISSNHGPAVIGLTRAQIVLPEWVLSVSPARRALILAHERAHVQARDHLLLVFAIVLTIVMPWNLLLWWQQRRLRLAIEMDCDTRVLREAGDVMGYASLLVDVGSRTSRLIAAPALAERPGMLERRIRTMLKARRIRPAHAALFGAAAVAVAVISCETPMPGEPQAPQEMLNERDGAAAVQQQDTIVKRPVLKNRDETSANLVRYYPPLLRDAGIGGSARLRLHVTTDGEVASVELVEGTGHDALDRAAVGVAERMVFEPALLTSGQPGAAVIESSIVFSTKTAAETERRAEALRSKISAEAPGAVQQERDVMQGPMFTPYTTKPELLNREHVRQQLALKYPPVLRAAGVGGTVLVWTLIDEKGQVTRVQVKESSGHSALDEAGVAVVKEMRWTAATNRGTPVKVWIQLPIVFKASTS